MPRSNTEKAQTRYDASVAALAATPSMLPTSRRGSAVAQPWWPDFRSHLETQLQMLRGWRNSEIEHDALVAQYLLPRRSLWLTQGGVDQPVPNAMNRNLPINQAILDPTGTLALRVASAGMVEGLMSPSRPWFKLKAGIRNFETDQAATLWFEDVEERMYAIMAHSNFYDCAAQMMEDLLSYGTGPTIIYEDDEDVIRGYNPCAGEYYLGYGGTDRVTVFCRMFVFTVLQMVQRFGLANCPADVQEMWRQKGSNLQNERIIAHCIEPNYEVEQQGDRKSFGKVAGNFSWREVYWVWGSSSDKPLEINGFMDEPFIAPRFWLRPGTPYGDSPGKDTLPDIMQLQQETMRKAELLEKHVRPPLNVPVELKNQPSSILPGRQNYTTDTSKGIQPIFKVDPAAIQHITNDLKEIQARIKVGFFNDLFLMLASATKDMTAYEVAQRQQEKLQVLGPVIERFNNEAASKAIKRIFAIMVRKRLIPPLPDSLRNVPIQVEYISMLALAQRAVATAGIERLKKMQGFMAATNKKVLFVTDDVELLREYAEQLGVTHKGIRPPDEVEKLWQQELQTQKQAAQQAQAHQAATEVAPALTDAARNLGDIDVGGGINAAQLMLGNAGGAAGASVQ